MSAAVLELVSAAPTPSLTAASVRSSVGRLRRCAASNAELRLRFASTPLRFLDSEVELHEAVRAVAAVATSPELYPELLGSGGLEEVVALLAHDNADIANAAVASLHDLLDADTLQALEQSTAEEARRRLVHCSTTTAHSVSNTPCSACSPLPSSARSSPATLFPRCSVTRAGSCISQPSGAGCERGVHNARLLMADGCCCFSTAALGDAQFVGRRCGRLCSHRSRAGQRHTQPMDADTTGEDQEEQTLSEKPPSPSLTCSSPSLAVHRPVLCRVGFV